LNGVADAAATPLDALDLSVWVLDAGDTISAWEQTWERTWKPSMPLLSEPTGAVRPAAIALFSPPA